MATATLSAIVARRPTRAKALPPLGLIVLAVLPLVLTQPYHRNIVIVGMIYAVVASNWDLTLGRGGIFNFAHIAFFTVGAYASTIVSAQLGIDPWLAIVVAAIVAPIAAAIAYVPLLRLRGVYIALITFAFGQLILSVILGAAPITGGAAGLVGTPALSIAGHSFLTDGKISYYYSALALLTGSTLFLLRIGRSRVGLSLVALRDSESLARSRGISAHRQRFLGFLASAIFTGAAGAFYADYLQVVSPGMLGFSFTSLVLSMLLLGGLGTVYGPILGALVLTVFSQAIDNLDPSLGPIKFMVVSAVIIVVILFIPSGLWGSIVGSGGGRRRMTLPFRRRRSGSTRDAASSAAGGATPR